MRIGRVASLTDTGKRRLRNEDAYVCDPPLFAIADGMGGAQAGELASQLAAAAITERERGVQGEGAVTELVQAANARVYRRALEDPAAAGMGTTVTVAVVDAEASTVTIGHVGDSRAYRIRDDTLEQLTADHSLVAELVRTGRLTPEQAAEHPHRSVITRAVGTEPSVDVDTFTLQAVAGDLYLLCSDGLTDMVDDAEILALAGAAAREPEAVARLLVDAANTAGGSDNITVVAFEIVEGESDNRGSTPAEVAVEMASAPAEATATPTPTPVRRRGAGKGGRALALLALLVVFAAASLVVWWSIHR
jgi:serine/threonine protein phosphatase PrpC